MTTSIPRKTRPRSSAGGWSDRGDAWRFWLLGVFGVGVMWAAWVWYGAAHEEEMSEQSKALSAGTSMEGMGAVLGVPPLIAAHLAGLLVLGFIAVRARQRRWTGVLHAVLVVAGASLIALVVAQIMWGGELFLLGARHPDLAQ
jgi:hypothetical protein